MFFDFLISLLAELRDAGPLLRTTSLIALLALVTGPIGLGWAWYRRGVTQLKEKNAELARENRELRRARDGLAKEVEGLGRQTIPALVETMRLERRDGNEERAIALGRSFVDHDAAALGPLCREIAGWHLSMVEDAPPSEHWNAAKRFATLATHLEPNDRTATALLAEINARTGEAALRAGDIEATRRDWEEAWHWAPALEDDATLVDVLLERLPKVRERGDYFQFLALAQRAIAAARRQLGSRHEATFTAQFYHIEALSWCGRAGEALDELDRLLLIKTAVSGERHPGTLSTHSLRASVLQHLGRAQEALDEIDRLLPVETGVRGERHSNTLATRGLRAYVLRDLGRADDALEEIDRLLPVRTAVSGERHPETLATRFLRASLFQRLGRTGEALDEADRLLLVQTDVIGGGHPDTLTTLSLRGSILRAGGEVEAALATHRGVYEGRLQVLGDRHPSTLYAAAELGLSLAASGDAPAAEALLAATLAAQSEVLGAEHPDTRRTQEALAALRAQGDGVSIDNSNAEPAPSQSHC